MKLILIGRPGSGKTTASHVLKTLLHEQGWDCLHFSDYPILYELFLDEKIAALPRRFQDMPWGGFSVLDFSVCDEALRLLETRVLSHTSREETLLILEFARADYEQAFQVFSPALLSDARYLYIDTPLETCIERIGSRVRQGDIYVAEDIMRGYYAEQVLPGILLVECIENTGTQEAFEEQVRQFASTRLKSGTDMKYCPTISRILNQSIPHNGQGRGR